jgi:hypothetical protein
MKLPEVCLKEAETFIVVMEKGKTMIKITNISVYNFENAIRGMRNPLNSWDKSDSYYDKGGNFVIGENDLNLALKLANAGTDHRKFLRQIFVSMDITAPLYWWKEFDTYKVGTVANSCSTMHKIHDKEFTLDDFSHEHLDGDSLEYLEDTICRLNHCRHGHLIAKREGISDAVKHYWWQMIQLLPTSYNQLRTVTLNYEVLRNIYHSRKNHKLDEWHTLCDAIEQLPHSILITEKEK